MRFIKSTDMTFVAASHEDPKNPGVLKKVIATKEQVLDGSVQMINWAQLPVGSSFRRHYHEDMEETFVVVTGRAEMRVENDTLEVSTGDTVVVSPGEIHEMKNVGDIPVEYIVIGVSLGQGGQTVVVER